MVSQAALELLVTMKDEASSGFGSLGGVLKTVGGIAGGVALAGVAAFGAAVVSGVGDAREAAGLLSQTNAVIKSTGGAAGVSAQQVVDYATALSDASGASLFGDDQIQQSENLLLTFTNIKDKTLEAATAISVDMAQALGGAPKDSAIQLGKALNDPIAGISALTRVGVTFTKEQKDQIKTMQDAGNMAGAQAVILAELNKEFGGSAQAAADATGGWSEFQGRLGEAKEMLGAAVLPLLNMLAGVLLDTVMPAIEAGAAAFGPFVEAITFLIDDLVNIGPLSGEFGESLGGIAQALGLPLPLVDLLEKGIFALQDVFTGLMATFTDSSTPVEGFLGVLSQVSPTFAIVRTTVETALPVVQQIVEQVFGFIQTFIDQNGADITASVRQAWSLIQDIIATISPLISGIVLGLTIVIRDFLTAHGTEITAILNNAWTIIKNVVLGALEIIKGLLQAALAIFRGDWEGAWIAIQTMSISVTKRIWEIIKAALDLIANFFGTSLEGIKNTWIGNWNALVEIVGKIDWMALGISVIDGITGGLLSKAASLAAAAAKVATDAWEAGKKAIGMGSPAKKWMPLGKSMMEGVAKGIDDTKDVVVKALKGVFDQGSLFGGMASAAADMMKQQGFTDDFIKQQTEGIRAQEQQLNFLQQQAKLIDFVRENGIEPGILEGINFGVNADPLALMNAMQTALSRTIDQASGAITEAARGVSGLTSAVAGSGQFGGLMEDDPRIVQLYDKLGSLSKPAVGTMNITVNINGGNGQERADAKTGVRAALDAAGDRALGRIKTGG